jgi:diguanylate cyclase (GGDEF)-like protein
MTGATSAQLDSSLEELIEESRRRAHERLSSRERWTGFCLGTAFVVAAAAVALVLPEHRPLSIPAAVVLVLAYALVSRVEFEIGAGFAVPSQLVLVPMLVLLPPSLVPLLVCAALVVGDLGHALSGIKHVERVLLAPSFAWHSIGPAVVVAIFVGPDPNWQDWPVFAAALAAQFVVDGLVCLIDQSLAVPVSPRHLLPLLGWAWTIDSMLTPAALVAAFTGSVAAAVALAFSVAAVLTFLARGRKKSIERALQLADAYRQANAEARRDALTGLANRLAWREALMRPQEARPVSVIVLDVDGLKRANDARGHDFGDRLLRAVATAVRAAAPAEALVARIGGDEFGVLLPAGAVACADAAAALKAVLARHPGVEGFSVDATIGFAVCAPGETLEDAQKRADAQMYEHKSRAA